MSSVDVSRRITEAREAAGLTPEQLAVAVGRSSYAVRAWEQGWRNPNPRSLAAIADATGKTIAWFYVTEREAA